MQAVRLSSDVDRKPGQFKYVNPGHPLAQGLFASFDCMESGGLVAYNAAPGTGQLLGKMHANVVHGFEQRWPAWKLNGAGGAIDVTGPDVTQWNPRQASFSIEGWYKSTQSGVYRQVWGAQNANNSNGFNMRQTSANQMEFTISSTSSGEHGLSTTQTVNDGKWHHCVGVRDYGAGKMFIYHDGLYSNERTEPNLDVQTAAPVVLIGATYFGTPTYRIWDGHIAIARMWKGRALTPSDVLELYLKPFDMFRPPNPIITNLTLARVQEGYRWRADDGDEDAASWLANQDTDISRARDLNTRIRILTDISGDPPSEGLKIQFREVGSGDPWQDVQ